MCVTLLVGLIMLVLGADIRGAGVAGGVGTGAAAASGIGVVRAGVVVLVMRVLCVGSCVGAII